MGYSNILDAVDIINNRVEPYDGHRVYLDTGGLQINKIEDIREFDFESKPSRANQNVRIHDIILARMKGTIKVKVISAEESDFMVSTGFIVLRAKQNVSDINFLNHIFLSDSFQRDKDELCTGATQKAINNTNFKKLWIYLPPLDQQKQIASVLDTADAYRQKTKALIEKYDALTQSLFLDMFGDPVTNPKGWGVKKLKDLTDRIGSGNTPKGGSENYVSKGITFFRSQNVWRNRIELDDVVFIPREIHDKMAKTSLKHRDILMTKTGRINTENSSLGRASMYLGEDDKANLNGHVYLIRPKKEANNEFILFILTTIQYRDYIRRVCVGGIDKRQINKDHIEDFPIINPPDELKNKFVSVLNHTEKQKALTQQELEKAEELFNSLLQKAFKGDLV